MRTRVLLILTLALTDASWVHSAAAEPYCGAHDLKQGFLREDVLYVAGPPDKEESFIRLWQAKVRAMKDEGDGERSQKLRGWQTMFDSFPTLRWRVAPDGIWSHQLMFGGCSNRVLWEDVPLLDKENEKHGEAALRKKYGIDPKFQGTVGWTQDNLSYPAQDMALDLQLARMKQVDARDFQLDFLPKGKDSFDLYVFFEKTLTIFHNEWNRKENKWDFKKGDVIRADFHEPILAYGKPETPFFVTKSGKLYHLVRPDKEKPKVVCLWDDAKRPLTTILADTNSGRSFALGVDQREGKDKQRFYLELTDKPEAVAIDPKEWPTVKVSEPLAPMLQFARYLDAKKKLTVP